MIHFLLDTSIFGIDADRDPQNADKVTLLEMYQPSMMLPKQVYNVKDEMAHAVRDVYKQYLLQVNSFLLR